MMNFASYGDNHEQFREDALKETGLFGHPKADWAYSLAWKNGWEGGLEEVFHHLDDIANMVLEGVVNC